MLPAIVSFLAFAAAGPAFAAPPALPANYPAGQYDEDKVPAFTLPDPLLTRAGAKVTHAQHWRRMRRPEILALFAEHVYGITPIGRPKEFTWTVGPTETISDGDVSARVRNVRLLFAGRADGPKMDLRVILPVDTAGRVPVFLMVGTGYPPWPVPHRPPLPSSALAFLKSGYGLVTCDVAMVDPDRRDGYAEGVRAFYAGSAEKQPAADAWGAIGAWAWAMSRAMDYLEGDADIDPARVALIGFSRYGKAAMWAGAQDERIALVCSGLSGCAGATLVRRGFGETVGSITGFAPYWFAKNFRAYADRVNELPVDWHMLIACIAPRPIYLATAAEDYWNDPHGQFLAAVAAEPVYRLLGKTGLGTAEPPPLNETIGDTVAYHRRAGGHSLSPVDLERFIAFADRHFADAR